MRLRPGSTRSLAARRPVTAVGVQAAKQRPAAFLDARLQAAVHQSEPVAVQLNFVVRIHCGDRIFAVLNGGEGGFEQHVADAGWIVPADEVRAIDVQFHVQSVVHQQQRASGAPGSP